MSCWSLTAAETDALGFTEAFADRAVEGDVSGAQKGWKEEGEDY